MFRYDRPPRGAEPKVNAERHKDLGLLSLVVGHSPGLQALDAKTNAWVSVEDEANLPPGSIKRSGGLTATLLSGETLALLSRGVYRAGVHRVVCAPSSSFSAAAGDEQRENENGNGNRKDDPSYRFSIVYTLRAAPAPLFTRNFESKVVGLFGPGEVAEGLSSAVVFDRIMKAHWNVNAAPSVREGQIRKFEARKRGVGREGENGQERVSG